MREQAKSRYKPCKTCGGSEVIRYAFNEGTGERVIVECRHCERRRADYTRQRRAK